MDDETLEALRGFGGVWGRVEGRAEAAPALGDLAEAASRQCELLSALARVCPRSSARLRRMASEEAALAARLRAEDFLAGGGGPRGSGGLRRGAQSPVRPAGGL